MLQTQCIRSTKTHLNCMDRYLQVRHAFLGYFLALVAVSEVDTGGPSKDPMQLLAYLFYDTVQS
jgi:hypothetical protein